MTRLKSILVLLLLTAFTASVVNAQGNLSDPYEILNRHFEANGGLANLKAEHSQYLEADLSVAGLSGTIKSWTEKPMRSRTEVDLKVLKITQGDNGEVQWTVDSNGKLQMTSNLDDAAIKRREIARRVADFEYADPNSDIFKLMFEGDEQVEGKDCYVLKMTNSINDDSYTSYINVDNFMLEKAVNIAGEESGDSYYGDYRPVGKIKVAFWSKQVSHLTGQEQEIKITKYESNPEIDPAIFEPPQAEGKDYRFTSGDRAENIPFKLIGNHLFIPVVVDCKERLWVLDTGASMSVINRRFADELGLELQGDLKGRGTGGVVGIKFATLPAYGLKGIEFNEQTVAVIDMDELIDLIGTDVAGILGFDFLSRFVTKVDYASELVSFYDPETFQYNGSGHELDVHMKGSVFTVQAALDGAHAGTWLFDLGASTTSLTDAYAHRNGFPARKGVEGLGHGAVNFFSTKRIKCDKIELGGFEIDRPTIGFTYKDPDTTTIPDEIGTLGNSLFRNFVVYCDYLHERLILEPGSQFNQQFPEDGSGLQFMLGENGEFKVLFVADGTPAAKAGFKKDDVVLAINGIDVGALDGLNTFRDLLKKQPGTEYTLLVDRDGLKQSLKLKLADLYQ